MTTELDTKAAAAVARAMAKMPSATFVQYGSSSYNTATREVEEGAATNTTVKLIPPYLNSSGFNLGGMVKQNTFFAPEALLTGISGVALATAPKVGDEIVYASKRYTITGKEEIRAGDDVALYLFSIDEVRGV